ncbi:MAG: MaoC family dehydratase [Jatrophihabitantaceae bacterium]
MRKFASAAEVIAAKGETLGTSGWRTITQEQINLFADATDDHQWIHIDPEKAATGPFGAPIAHGYLSLSLLAAFSPEIITVEGVRMSVNYGLDRVRFLTPVRVNSRVRSNAELLDAIATDAGVRISVRHTVEIEGEAKPALVADALALLVW